MKKRFQNLPFTFDLHRYSKALINAETDEVGLVYESNPADP